MKPSILITFDHNEHKSDRQKALANTILSDARYKHGGFDDLPVDLLFAGPDPLLVELKEPADFVSSVLSGHLYDQCLTLRENGLPCLVLITGEMTAVYEANAKACQHRGLSKAQMGQTIASNYLRLKSFRKRAYLNGIRCFYPGDDSGFFDGEVWKDLLDLVSDIFTDGSLLSFRPRPAGNERQVIALATLCKIGPKAAKSILDEFGSFREAMRWLEPYNEACRERLLEIEGIGPKTVAGIWGALA